MSGVKERGSGCFLCHSEVDSDSATNPLEQVQLLQNFQNLLNDFDGGDGNDGGEDSIRNFNYNNVSELTELSVCENCEDLMDFLVEKMVQVDQVEGEVRKLQRELLGKMKSLKGHVEELYFGLEGIQEKILKTSENCEERRSTRRNNEENEDYSRRFRGDIKKAIRTLSSFRGNVNKRISVKRKTLEFQAETNDDLRVKEEPASDPEPEDDTEPDWLPSPSSPPLKKRRGKYKTSKKSPSQPLPCPKCDKYFKNRHLLKLHQEVHLDPYQRKRQPCPHCGVLLLAGGSFQSHLRKDCPARKFGTFSCSSCPLTFETNQLLRKHRETVHFVKRSCPHCGKLFTKNLRLKQHIESVHQKIRHRCTLCERKFARRTSLAAHLEKVHGQGSPDVRK